MTQPSNPGLIASLRVSCVQACFSRLLLVVATLVLMAAPVTQNLWTWDRFLHGGHDFETNLVLILAAFCLVLLLAQRMQPNALVRFAVLLWRCVARTNLAAGQQVPVLVAGLDSGASPPRGVCNVPLLI